MISVNLFEPYDFNGKLSIRNHIVMPPLVTRLATSEGEVTDELVDRYLLYARGGAGMIVTEAVSVERQKSGQLLRLNDDAFIPGLRRMVRRVHEDTEAKIATQIIHLLKIARRGYRQKVEDVELDQVQ